MTPEEATKHECMVETAQAAGLLHDAITKWLTHETDMLRICMLTDIRSRISPLHSYTED